MTPDRKAEWFDKLLGASKIVSNWMEWKKKVGEQVFGPTKLHTVNEPTYIDLQAQLEQLRVQLAGCGVAAMQNTDEATKDRISKDSYGWSASYQDVCNIVDREIALRKQLEEKDKTLDEFKAHYIEDTNCLEDELKEAEEIIRELDHCIGEYLQWKVDTGFEAAKVLVGKWKAGK